MKLNKSSTLQRDIKSRWKNFIKIFHLCSKATEYSGKVLDKRSTFLILISIIVILIIISGIFLIKIKYSNYSDEIVISIINNSLKNVLPTIKTRKQDIVMLFFGDIMLDRHVKEKIDGQGFNYLFREWQLPLKWQRPDIQMANLEGAVIEDGVHYLPNIVHDFAFSSEVINELKDYNFNFFSIANNHILDQGQRGLEETRNNLEQLGFNYVGCTDKKVDGCSLRITEVGDRKIVMLAYSMVYGSLDEEKILQQIKDIRDEVDLTVVNMHWGVEYEHQANVMQKELARKMIDAGVDLIIGHHPHVVQEVEIYKNKAIFYSLGNFIFDQYFSQATQEGLAVGVTYKDSEIQIDLLPFYSEYSQVQLMADKKKEGFLNWLAEISEVEENYKKQIRDGKIILDY